MYQYIYFILWINILDFLLSMLLLGTAKPDYISLYRTDFKAYKVTSTLIFTLMILFFFHSFIFWENGTVHYIFMGIFALISSYVTVMFFAICNGIYESIWNWIRKKLNKK